MIFFLKDFDKYDYVNENKNPVKLLIRKLVDSRSPIHVTRKLLRVSERFDKTIVSAWKIAVSMILCNGRPA